MKKHRIELKTARQILKQNRISGKVRVEFSGVPSIWLFATEAYRGTVNTQTRSLYFE